MTVVGQGRLDEAIRPKAGLSVLEIHGLVSQIQRIWMMLDLLGQLYAYEGACSDRSL